MDMKISVKVIGTDPPCSRCHWTYELVGELAEELGIDVDLEKLVVGTEEAERYGRCVSLRQFAELVDEPMPDVSKEFARGDAPAVVINDVVRFFGQVPKKKDLREALQEPTEGGEA